MQLTAKPHSLSPSSNRHDDAAAVRVALAEVDGATELLAEGAIEALEIDPVLATRLALTVAGSVKAALAAATPTARPSAGSRSPSRSMRSSSR